MVSHPQRATRVPPESAQFRFGPMGTEEVVIYFDLVRDLIMAAWRWVDDDPAVTHDKLTGDLLLYIEGWLSSPIQRRAVEPSCATSSTWSAH